MSETTHTSGPWEWVEAPDSKGELFLLIKRDEPLLLLAASPPPPGTPTFEDFEANLRIIAKAPRMLEVLKKTSRLRSLDCEICTMRIGLPERSAIQQEAAAIEAEIAAAIAEAERSTT